MPLHPTYDELRDALWRMDANLVVLRAQLAGARAVLKEVQNYIERQGPHPAELAIKIASALLREAALEEV